VFPFRLVPQPGIPIADQVVYAAKKAILSRKLRPGDAFPSVRALARAMKIHPNTAQKVVAQLTSEGLLDVQPGVGTAVARASAARSSAQPLRQQIEALVVDALHLGISLEDLRTALDRQWQILAVPEAK